MENKYTEDSSKFFRDSMKKKMDSKLSKSKKDFLDDVVSKNRAAAKKYYKDKTIRSVYRSNKDKGSISDNIKKTRDRGYSETNFDYVENNGAKHFLHKRNKYMGLVSPIGAIANHYTKAGKKRRRLIAKSKHTNLTEDEVKELRRLNHVRTNTALGNMGGYVIPVLGNIVGAKIMRNEVHKRTSDQYTDEDNFDGGCGAGSPGMSSVGSMGGNTNKGMKALPKGAEERTKAYVLNQMNKGK